MLKKAYILFYLIAAGFAGMAQHIDAHKTDSLIQALAVDPENYEANYGLGMLYYEEAVKIIAETSYDIDLITLDDIQGRAVDLFKKALPYLEKAYQLNPAGKEVLSGLSALYYSLNELDKAEEFKNK